MENRSEDPALRIAEGSWWPLGEVGRRSTRGEFFVHSSGREDGRWGVLRAETVEDGGVLRSSEPDYRRTPPHLRRNPPSSKKFHPSLLPSDLRPILRGRRWGFFDFRGRRSKIEDGMVLRSSAPKIEDGGFLRSSVLKNEDEGVFDLRTRRSKIEDEDLRSSASKIEEGGSSKKRVLRRREEVLGRRGSSSKKREVLRRRGSSKKRGL